MSDVDKSIIDFDPVLDSKETDVSYLTRGLLSGRDKHTFKVISKIRDREALEYIYGKASVVTQDAFVITGNADAEFSSDIPILVLFRYDFGAGEAPVLYNIPIFTDSVLFSGVPITGAVTNYLYATFDPIVGDDGFKLYSSLTEPTSNTEVLLATYTATGAAGSFVITITGVNDTDGSLIRDFDSGNDGTETTPDSFFGRLGKKLREGIATIKSTRLTTHGLNLQNVGAFSQVGSSLSIPGMSLSAIASLSSTDIAHLDTNLGELRTYRFNGGTWSQVGSGLSVVGASFLAIASLSSTDIAFIDSNLEELRTYRFNGSTWSQVGSGLSVVGTNFPAMSSLSSTDIALIDSGLKELRTYRFNGSTWSQVGSGLSITGMNFPAMSSLSSTDIAFVDSGLNELRTYRFNGSTWSQVGSGLSVSSSSLSAITSLSSTDIAFTDSIANELRTYRFSGSTWSQVGSGLSILGSSLSVIASLSSTDIALIDITLEVLRAYELNFLDFPPNPAFGTL